MRLLPAVLLALAIACSSSGRDDAELERAATQSMRELNAADAAVPRQITEALSKLTSSLFMGTSDAADTITTKILPLVDSYVATIDRAVAAADAYLATKDDNESRRAVDVIRKRGEAFRKARTRFADLEHKARAGATIDEISQGLINIGLMLSISQ